MNRVVNTPFITHEEEYEFLRCPFGLCISGNQFQRFVNTVFRDILNDGMIVVYMEDFIIPPQEEKEGLEKFAQVFKVASEYCIKINLKIVIFLKCKIEFLDTSFEIEQ